MFDPGRYNTEDGWEFKIKTYGSEEAPVGRAMKPPPGRGWTLVNVLNQHADYGDDCLVAVWGRIAIGNCQTEE